MKTYRELVGILTSWRSVNSTVAELSEQELVKLMDIELSSNKRKSVIDRIYSRYTTVQAHRERKQLKQYLGASEYHGNGRRKLFKEITKIEDTETGDD